MFVPPFPDGEGLGGKIFFCHQWTKGQLQLTFKVNQPKKADRHNDGRTDRNTDKHSITLRDRIDILTT